MYRSTEKKQIVISFRGTSSPKDMLTDMSLDMAAFDPAGVIWQQHRLLGATSAG